MREQIALVTGASRGVGRGIAHELGVAGATVYVTGRSREGEATTDNLPGTIDGAARLVTDAGGKGIPVACDHTEAEAIASLAATIEAGHGRLDLLVNNVWGGYEQYDALLFSMPVWEQPIWRWDKMFATGVRAHYLTTRAVLPLLLQSERPFIANISAGDDYKYLGDVQYDVAKYAVTRLGYALSRALATQSIPVVTIYPGFTRTERVEAEAPPEQPAGTHSARFVGRCVLALANDPEVAQRSGKAFRAGDLGLEYGFTDIDGSQPESFTLPEDL